MKNFLWEGKESRSHTQDKREITLFEDLLWEGTLSKTMEHTKSFKHWKIIRVAPLIHSDHFSFAMKVHCWDGINDNFSIGICDEEHVTEHAKKKVGWWNASNYFSDPEDTWHTPSDRSCNIEYKAKDVVIVEVNKHLGEVIFCRQRPEENEPVEGYTYRNNVQNFLPKGRPVYIAASIRKKVTLEIIMFHDLDSVSRMHENPQEQVHKLPNTGMIVDPADVQNKYSPLGTTFDERVNGFLKQPVTFESPNNIAFMDNNSVISRKEDDDFVVVETPPLKAEEPKEEEEVVQNNMKIIELESSLMNTTEQLETISLLQQTQEMELQDLTVANDDLTSQNSKLKKHNILKDEETRILKEENERQKKKYQKILKIQELLQAQIGNLSRTQQPSPLPITSKPETTIPPPTRIEKYLKDLEYDDNLVLDPSLHFRVRLYVGINQKINKIVFHDTGRQKDFKDLSLRKNERLVDAVFETIVCAPIKNKDPILRKFLDDVIRKKKFTDDWKMCQINIKENTQQKLTSHEHEYFETLITAVSDFFGGLGDTKQIEKKCEAKILQLKKERGSNIIFLGDLKGSGICRHRSILFKLVCDIIGIRCRLLRGWIRQEDKNYAHCWNMILVGGRFYMVDATRSTRLLQDSVYDEYISLGGPEMSINEDIIQKHEQRRKELATIESEFLEGRRTHLDSGAFASVYVCEVLQQRDDKKKRRVCVKEVNVTKLGRSTSNSNFMGFCEKEIKFMSYLNQSNVIELLGHFKHQKVHEIRKEKEHFFCIVMPFYNKNGQTFKAELDKQKNVDDDDDTFQFYKKMKELLIFLIEVCRGLRYIHSVGVIHFDLCPNNILVDWNPENNTIRKVVITDFGGAKEKKSYRTQLPAGTEAYQAPEIQEKALENKVSSAQDIDSPLVQLGDFTFNKKSDIWSFGKIMEFFGGYLEGFPELTKLQQECIRLNPDRRPSLEKMIYMFKNRLRYVDSQIQKEQKRKRKGKRIFEPHLEESEGEDEEEIVFRELENE